MANAQSSAPLKPVTPEAFLASRLAFWERFNVFTLKTTVSLLIFCAWFWWAGVTSFSFLHVITLPIAVGIAVVVL
jgi:hypothetical protein